MKTEGRIFAIPAVFLFVTAAAYATWTYYGLSDGVEWIGTVAMILGGFLLSMCGGFFWFVSRRIEPRPEDREDAEVSDGAGEIGFFSPGSYWPFGLALAAATAFVGLALWQAWLVGVGILAAIMFAAGLLFEYYSGTRRAVEH